MEESPLTAAKLAMCGNSQCDNAPSEKVKISFRRVSSVLVYQMACCSEHRHEAEELVKDYQPDPGETMTVEWSVIE